MICQWSICTEIGIKYQWMSWGIRHSIFRKSYGFVTPLCLEPFLWSTLFLNEWCNWKLDRKESHKCLKLLSVGPWSVKSTCFRTFQRENKVLETIFREHKSCNWNDNFAWRQRKMNCFTLPSFFSPWKPSVEIESFSLSFDHFFLQESLLKIKPTDLHVIRTFEIHLVSREKKTNPLLNPNLVCFGDSETLPDVRNDLFMVVNFDQTMGSSHIVWSREILQPMPKFIVFIASVEQFHFFSRSYDAVSPIFSTYMRIERSNTSKRNAILHCLCSTKGHSNMSKKLISWIPLFGRFFFLAATDVLQYDLFKNNLLKIHVCTNLTKVHYLNWVTKSCALKINALTSTSCMHVATFTYKVLVLMWLF